MNSSKPLPISRLIPLLASMVAITPLAIDMYLPAMPLIAKQLGTSSSAVQVSLSVYLAGYALGMMLFGPIADRVGRRAVALVGMAGFIVCSLLLAWSESIAQFVSLRFIQAAFGSGATVVVPGIIRDLYKEHTAKGLSYVSLIMMVAPMVAPAIGSLILQWSVWQTIFLCLAGYASLILLLVLWKLPKNLPLPTQRNWLAEFSGNYRLVFSHRQSRLNIISSMMGSFAFFCYITTIAFVYIEYFGVSEGHFSILFGANVASLMLTNVINSRLVERYGSRRLLKVGTAISLGFACLLALVIFLDWPLYWVVATLFPLIGSLALITVNADGLILNQFPQQTGTATAVIGTLRFGSGALAGPALGLLFNGTPNNFAILMLCSLSIVGLTQLLNRSPTEL